MSNVSDCGRRNSARRQTRSRPAWRLARSTWSASPGPISTACCAARRWWPPPRRERCATV
ncbi:hypothetical protein APY03_0150 [Variovorax sp. WDL1]|nr:hypothetical protein APY03_0150 [Variovorax sp. WDL1]